MGTELATTDFSGEKIELIKQTVAKGATNLELELFLHACKRTGLDPLMRQIYAIKRWNAKSQKEEMAIQTGIDGYRLIADRTGCYAGSDDPIFEGDYEGIHPRLARVTVHKFVNGTRCTFSASARWDEYVQLSREGKPTAMWQKMPYCMLGKCAEALALRKAFPAELSGVYTHEEMMQADNAPIVAVIEPTLTAPENGPETTAVPPVSRPTSPQAQDSSGAPVMLYPFKGPWKGKPITEINDTRVLQDAIEYIEKSILNPKNTQYRERNENQVMALQAEITRREEAIVMELDGMDLK